MNNLNEKVFVELFREACRKCFGHPLSAPLSETDSKLLSNSILQQTGLVIGVKSIKNYSQYVMNPGEVKKENPSVATLDTLARYVMDAPETDEIKRKKQESHHPYWYQYKSRFGQPSSPGKKTWSFRGIIIAGAIVLLAAITFLVSKNPSFQKDPVYFTDEFNSVSPDSLNEHGWTLKNEALYYWNKRDGLPGHLTLYTLIGDNWPDANRSLSPGIKNLLTRKINSDCFSAEIHLTHFIPSQSWQQAGILLAEDSSFSGKALRLSIGYNNFFGGYSRPAEILIQAVSATVDGKVSRPEEIAHISLFSGDPLRDSLIRQNLSSSALKIEKKGNHFRFLYTNGRSEGFAFKEAAHGDFTIQPRYIGVFAMQGHAQEGHALPVYFDSFSVINCQ